MTKPTVVCLCGSTRFGGAFAKANLDETLAGRIVLSIGCNMKSDSELFGSMNEEELKRIKTGLDELHKRKIDLADEILVLNVGGYVGDSTRSEIEYAGQRGKRIRWLEPQPAQPERTPLVEACEVMLAGWARSEGCWSITMENVRLALAAEKKRQELIAKCLDDYEIMLKMANHSDVCDCAYCTRLRNLDAFEKEAQ